MNRIFKVGILFLSGPICGWAQNNEPQTAPASDVDKILEAFSPAQEHLHRHYITSGKQMDEAKLRVEAARSHGDVIMAMIERLKSLQPGTAHDEAEILNLVKLLEQYPDKRALSALEKLSTVTPQVKRPFPQRWAVVKLSS